MQIHLGQYHIMRYCPKSSLSKKSNFCWFLYFRSITKTVIKTLEKKTKNREQVEFICLENLVPEDHLLRKIDSTVDFDKFYEFVEELYCNDNGRPSIDPVILFKMVLIQHLYRITSLRKVAVEVSINMAYRWFLGYTLNETIPHFSTLSYNFRHRFNLDTIDKIFNWILDEIAEAGYFNAEAVVQIILFYITNGSGFIFLVFICCLTNSLLIRDLSFPCNNCSPLIVRIRSKCSAQSFMVIACSRSACRSAKSKYPETSCPIAPSSFSSR